MTTAGDLPCVSEVGAARQARSVDARLTVVTPIDPGGGDLAAFLDVVLGASVDVVRLRDLEVPDEQLAAAAADARRVCDRHGALLLIDDRPEVALAVGADGVHVGRRGPAVSDVRARIGPDLLLWRSTTGVDDLAGTADEDVDHVTVPRGAAADTRYLLIRAAAAHSPHPWSAVGGIRPETVAEVLDAGARRVVVGSALTGSDDPAATAWELRRALGRVH